MWSGGWRLLLGHSRWPGYEKSPPVYMKWERCVRNLYMYMCIIHTIIHVVYSACLLVS